MTTMPVVESLIRRFTGRFGRGRWKLSSRVPLIQIGVPVKGTWMGPCKGGS